jgi:hypothetical protein
MGYSTYSHENYTKYRAAIATTSTNDLFKQNQVHTISKAMNPFEMTVRESRDSAEHPNTTAAIVMLDNTGSMGDIPVNMVKNYLGTLMTTLIARGLPDVQILFGMINDHISGDYPIQVGQFESGDVELTKWLTESYLEGGGGGGNHESYLMAWLFAARHTAIDCFEKRGKKGILFTIGDERSHTKVDARTQQTIFGYKEAQDATDKQLLKEARKMYNVFHIHVNEGSYPNSTEVLDYWEKLMDGPAIVLHNQTLIAETIATAIGAVEAKATLDELTSHFSKPTAAAVKKSLANFTPAVTA